MDFICEFKMENYPFDHQVCRVFIDNIDEEEDVVKLIPLEIINRASKDIMEYVLLEVSIKEQVI